LTNLILNALELNEPSDLIRWVHAANRDAIAQLAKVVFDAARTTDATAEQIVDEAVDELVCAADSVVKQLEFVESFDIVLSGGNLIHQTMFADKLRRQFVRIVPEALVLLPKHEPAYGAVLVAQARL
jgi:N-acetylglucosamine kinase